MYLEGDGVEKSYPEAVKWLRMGADNGDIIAPGTLAKLYLNGEGVDMDVREGIRFLKLASRGTLSSRLNILTK